jgi:hypothetical protein
VWLEWMGNFGVIISFDYFTCQSSFSHVNSDKNYELRLKVNCILHSFVYFLIVIQPVTNLRLMLTLFEI